MQPPLLEGLNCGVCWIHLIVAIACSAASFHLLAAAGSHDFPKVQAVIHERCTVCHSANPTSALFSTAPAGILLDTPEQIQAMALRIQAQAVTTPIMPLGNITKMTQEERDLIGQWVSTGASTH